MHHACLKAAAILRVEASKSMHGMVGHRYPNLAAGIFCQRTAIGRSVPARPHPLARWPAGLYALIVLPAPLMRVCMCGWLMMVVRCSTVGEYVSRRVEEVAGGVWDTLKHGVNSMGQPQVHEEELKRGER